MLLNYRLKRGKEHAARLPERRGESTIARPDGPLVWLHGASVGEMLSILPLIERIRARDIAVLVTSGTVTSAGIGRAAPAAGRDPSVRAARPAAIRRALPRPLAAQSRAVRRIRSVAQPDHGERRAQHSADPDQRPRVGALVQRWRLAPRTIGALLSRFDLCLAQSAEDAARYAGLGAPRYVTTGNLKLDVPAPPADPTKLSALQGRGRHASGHRRRLHPSGRGSRADRRASPAQAHLSGPADHHGAAPSGARPGHRRDRQGRGLKFRAALARRAAGARRPTSISPTRSASSA